MREIGVRELKATLSDVLRRVAAGEHVRVTVRSRPVADILPVGRPEPEERLRQLASQGRVTPSTRPRPARAPRLVHAKRSASEIVLADRDTER